MKLGFDPQQLTYIGSVLESYYAPLVGATKPWQTVEDFVAAAKGPQQLVMSNSSGFGIPDIAMAQFAQAAGGFEYRTLPTTGGAEQVVAVRRRRHFHQIPPPRPCSTSVRAPCAPS